MPRITRTIAGLLLGGAFVGTGPIGLIGSATAAEASIDDAMDAATPAWRQPPEPGGAKVLSSTREREGGPGQSMGIEHVRFACPAGYSGVFLYPVDRAAVVDEFRASVRVRGDRHGLRLAARVVLPSDEGDAQPKTTVVRSDTFYQAPGQWAELTLSGLPRLVKRQLRLLRLGEDASDTEIDYRAAYVDSLVLIVPGDPQGADFWVDHVRVEGPLRSAATTDDAQASSKRPEDRAKTIAGVRSVSATAAGLTVDGRVLFPRVWKSHGETPSVVSAAGFDTLAIDAAPDTSEAKEARDAGLRVICSPPDTLAESDAPQQLAGVLGWRLPDGVDAARIDSLRPLIDGLRNDTFRGSRPLIAQPAGGVAAWSRLSDALVLDATRHGLPPHGRQAGETFAGAWSTALPGTPALARVSLTPPPLARAQLVAFAPQGKAPRWRPVDAIRRDLWTAVAAGARGVWVDSQQPLGGALPEDRAVTATLELFHLKSRLIEPWLAGGQRAGIVRDSRGRVVGALLTRDRTRLIIGLAATTGETAPVAASPTAPPAGVVVPGVAETATAYAFTPAGLAPIKRRRVLGGVLLETPSPGPGELLLVTDDRFALRDLQQRAAKVAKSALALEQELVIGALRRWEAIEEELAETPLLSGRGRTQADPRQPNRGAPYQKGPSAAAAAKRLMSRSKAAEASGDLVGACLNAERAASVLRNARADAAAALTPTDRLDSSPLASHPAVWADEWRLRQLLGALPRSGNRLPGG